MGEKYNQWHPGFVAALQMELRENREDLQFEEEHNLSKKPLQVDLLVIKNDKNTVIRNGIGKLFRRYNIIEYKSPDDAMGIDVFYKVNAYACLYKSDTDTENLYPVDDITITLLRHNYPRTLMRHLQENGYTIIQRDPGIYEVAGKAMFTTQIIVSKELPEEEHIWLKSLRRDISKEMYKKLLLTIGQLAGREREIYGEAVLEVVSSANNDRIIMYPIRWTRQEKGIA
ncbi:MAG: 3-isopropylmalate dehydrogenase [Clostridium sp.]|nr:3-isopropylmalate dehydrogenase [Clostridium sp.]